MAAVGPYVFTYGGLRGSALLDDFLLADDSSGSELSICDPRSAAWCASSHLAVLTPLVFSHRSKALVEMFGSLIRSFTAFNPAGYTL